MSKYDYDAIALERGTMGTPWEELAEMHGAPSANTLRSSYCKWRQRRKGAPNREGRGAGDRTGNCDDQPATPDSGPVDHDDDDENVVSLAKVMTADQISRITSLEDLLAFFKVDQETWMVRDYRVNKWEQHSVKRGLIELYQVRANLIRRPEIVVRALEQELDRIYMEALSHCPSYEPIQRRSSLSAEGDPVLFELAVHDPHIGMLAWGQEVGVSYDSKIAVRDYEAAVEHLLSFALLYPTGRILYVVGHDMLHADSTVYGVKGSSRGGATTAGTMQDVDSRLAKMFTVARRAAVAGIDRARLIAPVTVKIVPGNHDAQQMYRMGEVLAAWYRNDPEVTVEYGPDKRGWYRWGRNGFLFTHGEEFMRQRDNLAMIFATEAPAKILTEATHWEVHTGHNHITKAGRYVPTSELTEARSIRVRSLPGITPEDAWHHENGYKHQRAATALIWRESGGMAGHHEFTL